MIKARKYENYGDYIAHQVEKLDDEMILHRIECGHLYRAEFRFMFKYLIKKLKMAKNSLILCLGARLGEEVQVWRKLGMKAIGIDLNPGQNNKLVIWGDFHYLPFKKETFNYIFSNSFDHCYHPFLFHEEMQRILKNKGIAILEVRYHDSKCVLEDVREDGKIWYESLFWETHKDLIETFHVYWKKMFIVPITVYLADKVKSYSRPRPCLIMEK